jgi:radical SAM protein (TIGR04043 family)
VTLTTGTTHGHDKGALYIGRCAKAIKQASGLPVEVQFEPPDDLSVLGEVHAMGADSVGMHIESFDPQVLARVAPAKARTGVDGYLRAWERAVDVFGWGQVSTYVIPGMGEDIELTVAGCRRAIDVGVYPFVVPLRPVPGTPMGDLPAGRHLHGARLSPGRPYLVERGLGSWNVRAGCARCQACSAMTALERSIDHDGRRSLPLVDIR